MDIDAQITMGCHDFHPNGQQVGADEQASFHIHGCYYTYKVTVELDNG